ncbi:MAG: hypothetical protein ACRDRJ_25730 [Streptosporangiaceae bacterium]
MTPTPGTWQTGTCQPCNGRRHILVIHYFTRATRVEKCTTCGGSGRPRLLPRWARPFSWRPRNLAKPLRIDGITYAIQPASETGRVPGAMLGTPWLAVIAGLPGTGSAVIAGWITTGPSPHRYGAYTGGGSYGPMLALRSGAGTPGTALRTVAAWYANWLRQRDRR